jgi:eukaryotic-like serine/threonine-protein kinase
MLESLRRDQQSRWKHGDQVRVAFYLKQYPDIRRDVALLQALVFEELRLRESAGQAIDKQEYVREYPECREAIEAYQSQFATIGPSIAELVQPAAPATDVTPDHTMAFETQAVPLETSSKAVDEYVTAPAFGSSTAASAGAPSPFPVVPGFEVLSELGRGGMGIVYRARQISANRTVALKIVRNEMLEMMPASSRAAALERFRTEAQAAASLQHDYLVSVYEVGKVPAKPGGSALHYYAMRFVRGESLFDIIRDGPLENRRAATYIQKVSCALQAAHDQGILHRDMKPHNVMIESGTDRPLVTDFGLAKFVDNGESMTYAGQVMGTPSYMSPEQAQDAASVTAAADQYSIGATLYHLLAGRPPFAASSVPETIRQIIDKQPVSLRELNSAVHRDVETICLKAIQKDPDRRYANCQALADDLQRYLDGVPIVARPVSRTERVWRWCRRNPALAGMIASVAVLALSTMAAIVVGYRNTSAALAVSESRLDKALQVVDELFTRVSEDELLDEPGMQPLRRDLLEKALKHYEYFLSESGQQEKLVDEVASAHFRVGMIQQLTGNNQIAERELNLARDQQVQLVRKTPTSSLRVKAYADTLNALGGLLHSEHRPADSTQMFIEASRYRSQLSELEPGNIEYQRLACNAAMNVGLAKIGNDDLQNGLIEIRAAQDRRLLLLEQHPEADKLRRDLARGWYSLGKFELEQQDFEGAREHFQQAVDAFHVLLEKNARTLNNRFDCSVALRLLGVAHVELGQDDLAAQAFEEAASLAERLTQTNPDVVTYQVQLALLAMNLGSHYENIEAFEQAQQRWSQALAIERQLFLQDSSNPDVQGDLVACLSALGDVERRLNHIDVAKGYWEEAETILKQLTIEQPENDWFREQLEQIRESMQELTIQ